jgi:hypothetical protein
LIVIEVKIFDDVWCQVFDGWIDNCYTCLRQFLQLMEEELLNIGFANIKHSGFGESDEEMFKLVEEKYRFVNAVSIECEKPLG